MTTPGALRSIACAACGQSTPVFADGAGDRCFSCRYGKAASASSAEARRAIEADTRSSRSTNPAAVGSGRSRVSTPSGAALTKSDGRGIKLEEARA